MARIILPVALVANPLMTLGFSFLSAVGLYLVPWSTYFPVLEWSVVLFLVILSAYSIFRGYAFQNKIDWPTIDVREKPTSLYSLILMILLAVMSYVQLGGLPFLNSLTIDGYRSKDLEMPGIIFPMMIGLSIYYFGVASIKLLVRRSAKDYILASLALLIPFIFMQRGVFFSQILSLLVMIFLRRRVIGIFGIVLVFVILLSAILLFGYIGQVRDSGGQYYRPITEIAGASHVFYDSGLDEAFFYVWAYITSPLANFALNAQDNITLHGSIFDNFSDFVLSEFVPDIFSKRIIDLEELEYKYVDLRIVDTLNVSTAFSRAYSIAGWVGATTVALYLVLVLELCIRAYVYFRPLDPIRSILFLSFGTVVAVSSIFDNMLSNSARIAPLLLTLLFSAVGLIANQRRSRV